MAAHSWIHPTRSKKRPVYPDVRIRDIPAFQVLRQGIDTLAISFPGKINQDAYQELKTLKELA
jgi:hypothetical protein